MKKIWSVILILVVATSCSASSTKNQKYHVRKKPSTSKSGRVASKYSNFVKPSESMQAGIPKNSKYVFEKNISDKNNEENFIQLSNDASDFVDENEKYSGIFKIGNPYKIFGVNYVPQDYEDFEEIGTASWYGDDFHGKPTANGETYNMGSMTAAHPTLPLPSLVKVTNLRNDKSVIVRVNDRGPFAKNRVIDVSEKAATLLDFKQHGTTEVKVELLRSDTDKMLEKLKIKN
jgi:rare lipoprotein A (peptidoglycan hydrolase)